jgi:hypothetical protein
MLLLHILVNLVKNMTKLSACFYDEHILHVYQCRFNLNLWNNLKIKKGLNITFGNNARTKELTSHLSI